MEYINLTITQLGVEAYRRSSLTDRGVWLTLLGYCVQQENGGRIAGVARWDEWDCLQVLGIPQRELDGEHRLWKFDGDDLLVEFYPLAKQREVQAKRRAGRRGGISSWEARAEHAESRDDSKAASSASSTASTEGNEKGKGKEEEGNEKGRGKEEEGKDGQRPQSLEHVKIYASTIGLPGSEAEKFFDHFTANGWRQGGRAPLRSWQAALRNWARRAGKFRFVGQGCDEKSSFGGGASWPLFDPAKPNAHTGGLPVFEPETEAERAAAGGGQ